MAATTNAFGLAAPNFAHLSLRADFVCTRVVLFSRTNFFVSSARRTAKSKEKKLCPVDFDNIGVVHCAFRQAAICGVVHRIESGPNSTSIAGLWRLLEAHPHLGTFR